MKTAVAVILGVCELAFALSFVAVHRADSVKQESSHHWIDFSKPIIYVTDYCTTYDGCNYEADGIGDAIEDAVVAFGTNGGTLYCGNLRCIIRVGPAIDLTPFGTNCHDIHIVGGFFDMTDMTNDQPVMKL